MDADWRQYCIITARLNVMLIPCLDISAQHLTSNIISQIALPKIETFNISFDLLGGTDFNEWLKNNQLLRSYAFIM